ncbi:acetylcholine receptor subunit beta-like 2 isoform X2 [Planococcus citri]|uniref:acetylcholine receptor subunit beta-like 2 isoform X2 n=1 Tax=Planococcus citri TaxID=170843 RepID=UPI0031F8EC4A
MKYQIYLFVVLFFIFLSNVNVSTGNKISEANPDAKRLYDDLLSNYNRLIRPVENNTEKLTVWLGLKLAQLTEVNLRNQVVTASIWVVQKWFDYKLRWDPIEYGGLEKIIVPSELIWLPDIVLYNNADGNFEVTLMTKANLKYDGEIVWVPPAIYKSSCEMNVLYFPFDEQNCLLKFGSWTYNGLQVDLKHIDGVNDSTMVDVGIDLSEFLLSVEWDLLAVPATKNEEFYPCCTEPYADITFSILMRRKTLFYTVNLIIPLVGITFLTVLVFYLPSDSGEKVTLCSSILVSLTVFFLLLAEIIPPTSLAVPLLGKYLLFTMTLVTLSICVTVCVLNVHFRSPATHKMSPWVRKIFLDIMPPLLMMRRPPYTLADLYGHNYLMGSSAYICDDVSFSEGYGVDPKNSSPRELTVGYETMSSIYKSSCSRESHKGHDSAPIDPENIIPRHMSPDVLTALQGVRFIANHIKHTDKENEVIEDWKYVSMVLDRFFLWVFTIACIVGTCMIICQAPSLYDKRQPIDQYFNGTKKNFIIPVPFVYNMTAEKEDSTF